MINLFNWVSTCLQFSTSQYCPFHFLDPFVFFPRLLENRNLEQIVVQTGHNQLQTNLCIQGFVGQKQYHLDTRIESLGTENKNIVNVNRLTEIIRQYKLYIMPHKILKYQYTVFHVIPQVTANVKLHLVEN